MSIKLQSLFIACIVYIYALDVANGRPDHRDTGLVEDTGLEINGLLVRAKRQFGCVTKGGCHKGYCWASCLGALSPGQLVSPFENPEWCYTTKTHSQSHQYVKCTNNNQCDLCWKCGGPCSV